MQAGRWQTQAVGTELTVQHSAVTRLFVMAHGQASVVVDGKAVANIHPGGTMTGSKQVVEAKDWADFKKEWRDTFGEYAKGAKIDFSFVEGEVAPRAEDGTVVRVDVADYRIVGIGMRIMFGIMTGNAYIDAKVKYLSLRDGTVFGEQQYNTSSSAGSGIFAKVTPQQVDAIGNEVFRDLKAAK
jgi:hypothetical protein